jgi:hypothetical protein
MILKTPSETMQVRLTRGPEIRPGISSRRGGDHSRVTS